MNNQTQNAIDIVLAESLKELAATKPIEKITIKEITDKAGVIRPTFYNHFQDKYELLEWITVNELFAPVEPLLSNGMLKEAVTFILTTMEKEKDFYKRAVMLEGQNSFNEIFNRCVARAVQKYLDLESLAKVANYPWLKEELVADFLAHSISWVTIQWINKGMKVPVEELTDVYVKIFHSPFIEIVSSLKK
ncbi:probable dihydroxyacetone kinase regulator [Pseudobutyrivibrio sp. 49]|uniref:TetR/AcrR family transcriptional regulator C-terminal domain-containing protein n=1 Tax=unclassified Pseudobutyrivibrio TaxID=2638619 RepID=UPI0008841D7E|nr:MULTISPECIES: TetR/AcrR family transcriptional regulator C-terminal domain-containing protein [unclassified Pseudobutyrivibrio]SDH26599.1 probable dihydroxyacetone kinase regulator [Pseudobutyrivibrio sp. 49]SFO16985.1 transcriptional regulator, TetR family [Pseudobutyrivibrio sp. UC1225]